MNNKKLTIEPNFNFVVQFFSINISDIFIGLLFIVMLYPNEPFLYDSLGSFLGNNIAIKIVLLIIFFKKIYDVLSAFFSYRKTNYIFDDNKVVYKEGFMTVIEKEIQYKNIKEVSLSQSILQRIFGYGDIVLSTSAESLQSGLVLRDITNFSSKYKEIKEIVGFENGKK